MELYQAYLRLLLVFPLVIILAYFGLRFFLGRFAPAFGMGRRVQVLERTALNSRTFLYVVKVGDDYLLVGLTANNVVLLKDLGPGWGQDFYGELGNTPLREEKPVSFAAILQCLRGGDKAGGWQKPGGESWRNLLSVTAKNTKIMAGEREDFANLSRNYKLRKVKEEVLSGGEESITPADAGLGKEMEKDQERED
ncbi:MAG: flagellar biosynthetic protein FliO [Bacillota bacterium]